MYASGAVPAYWRLELQPVPSLVVSEFEDGGYVERITAEPGGTTLIDKPFPVRIDPLELVRPRL